MTSDEILAASRRLLTEAVRLEEVAQRVGVPWCYERLAEARRLVVEAAAAVGREAENYARMTGQE